MGFWHNFGQGIIGGGRGYSIVNEETGVPNNQGRGTAYNLGQAFSAVGQRAQDAERSAAETVGNASKLLDPDNLLLFGALFVGVLYLSR